MAEKRMVTGGSRDGAFLAGSAIVFIASAVGTVVWCRSMSGGMPMPGGWTMSMAWMRMAGQTWVDAVSMFIAMWTLMMVAMMLPCLVPMLLNYRRSLWKTGASSVAWPTLNAGAGYILFWAIFGALAYPLGIALAELEMRSTRISRAVPLATALILFLAGLFQLTPFKTRCLSRCRDEAGCGTAGMSHPFMHGLRLGTDCAACCLGFMVLLLVAGVMDLRIMAIVTAAIAIERIVPRPRLVAQTLGLAIILGGVIVLVQSLHFD